MKKRLKDDVKKSYFTLIIGYVLLSCFNGCSAGGDYAKDLSGDYFYRDEGDSKKDILSHLPGKKDIYGEVLDYDYNDNFIVAKQKPIYEEYKSMIGFKLRDNLKEYPTNSKEEIFQSEKEADSILKHDPYYKTIFTHKINYWIISHKDNQMYGPLTKKEYIRKRKELNIPESLRVDD
ncbi:hypothetical protein [Arcticibacter tournemirensis]